MSNSEYLVFIRVDNDWLGYTSVEAVDATEAANKAVAEHSNFNDDEKIFCIVVPVSARVRYEIDRDVQLVARRVP